MSMSAPKIDSRTFQDLQKLAQAMAPFYAPEWSARKEKECGVALVKIYLHMYEQIISRLNQVPDKSLIAFLDMLGIQQQPAQSATVPITFTLAEGAVNSVLVPKGTQVTAESVDGNEEILFETENNLFVFAAALKKVISIDALTDRIFDHSQNLEENKQFELFTGDTVQEHSLYLAHDDLFNQINPTRIDVNFIIDTGARGSENLEFTWEYWNGTFWVTLASLGQKYIYDETNRFQKSGTMTLIKKHIGEIMPVPVNGIEKRWIRCRIKSEASPLTAVSPRELATINTICISVNPEKPLLAELVFNNDIPLLHKPIIVAMLGMDYNIEITGEIASPPFSPPEYADSSIFLKSFPELMKGDILEFDNTYDDPIRRIIQNYDKNTGYVEFTEKLEINQDETYNIRIITAVRRRILPKDDSLVEILVETLEGHENEISENSKIYLVNSGEKEFGYLTKVPHPRTESPPDLDNNAIKYQVNFEIKENISSYLEGDLIHIIPRLKPFGELPRLFDTFYIASDEAFSKKGADITLIIESGLYEPDPESSPPPEYDDPHPVLSWEYWNGTSWRGIRVADTTNNFNNFFNSGTISFTCPNDIQKAKVNGEEKYWIRTRIIDGDYGKEIEVEDIGSGYPGEVRAVKGFVHYPIITELRIDYKDVGKIPQSCLTYNNLNFKDCTDQCNENDKVLDPFVLLPEQQAGLFLGFDKKLVSGPLQLLFSLGEQFLADDDPLKVQWFYWNGKQWAPLNVVDRTENLTKVGILEWIGGNDFEKSLLFGKELYWLKASVIKGAFIAKSDETEEKPRNPIIKGIYPNTTYAFQAFVVEDEVMGSSDSSANQEFSVLKPPIISQEVWIQEPKVPSDDIKKKVVEQEGENAIKEVKGETGEIEEIWIRWHEVEDFDDSASECRHYVVDKRLGSIQFGDGKNGLIPPRGEDNVKANYKYGGGVNGNVLAGTVSGLKNGIPFVKQAVNHLDADSGSETETLDQVLQRGPQRLKNRDRAVTAEDFEWLAKNASRKVARAKCLPNIDERGDTVPGWVTIIILPDSQEKNPKPTRQLLKTVNDQLAKQSANIVFAADHIYVREPDYVEVTVKADVVPSTTEVAATVEKDILESLNRYLHPLTGGPDHNGWPFGKNICLSKIFMLIEGIADVDCVKNLVLYADGVKQKQDILINQYTMPYSGEHKISLQFQTGEPGPVTTLKKSECEDNTL